MLASGFCVDEAKALLAIIADLQGVSPPLPQPPLGPNWRKIFDPPPIGDFDNKWQLWQDTTTNAYAVVIRGTTCDPGSILEDILSVLIPASGTLPIGKIAMDYKLADSPQAAVHLGFTLGAMLLLFHPADGILTRLATLPAKSDVFITGHSQGAGIATLCRAFLNYSPLLEQRRLNYKTYVFAQPKPGNDHFGDDFERVVDAGRAFRVTNDQDWVPQVPFTLELPRDINEPNPMDRLEEGPFGLIPKLVSAAQSELARMHLATLQARFAELEQTLGTQTLQPVAAVAGGAELKILPTLNFMGCGIEVVRAGKPGTNPQDPGDFMWQHHAAMYYQLL